MLFFATIVIYVAVLLGVGVWKSRTTKTQDDFMVAGRTVSTWFLVGTLICTWIGSGSLFGGAGLAFREGIGDLWMSAGAWVGIVIVYFLAHRVRRIAQYTVADILEKRYTPLARILGTATVIVAYMAIAGYQFRGAGRLLNLVTADLPGGLPQISVEQGRLLSCALVIVFTLLAGMVSIVSIDIFNGILMIVGVLLALPLALSAVVGAGKYWNLPPFRGPDGSLDTAATETIILFLARHDLPVLAGCLLLGAGMAIIFSTANTFLMIPATNLARDIYQRFLNPEATETQVVRFQRIMIVVVGVLAYLLATKFTTILQMAFTAYTMVGAGLTPALLAAFLWKRVTPAGGTSSIAAGMLVTVLITWQQDVLSSWLSGLWGRSVDVTEYMIYPAVIASVLCLVVVSLLTPPSPEERWKPFL